MNNAGRSQIALVEKTSLEVDRALLDLNVVGTISLTKAVLPHMIERHEGQIVVVSSTSGKIGNYINFNSFVEMTKFIEFCKFSDCMGVNDLLLNLFYKTIKS